jgi:hypothetical protein
MYGNVVVAVPPVVSHVPSYNSGANDNAPLPVMVSDDGVMAPSVKVMAGVVVGFATLPLTPFAVATETLLTLPVGAAHVASERRKFVVPPPDAGAIPCRLLVNRFNAAVACVGVSTPSVPTPPAVVTKPFDVRFVSDVMFCDALTENVGPFSVRPVPAK